MLLILCEWLFTLACLLPVGNWLHARLFRAEDDPIGDAVLHAVLLGLAACTAYATVWSFFGAVDAVCALVLSGLSLVLLIVRWHALFALAMGAWQRWRTVSWPVRLCGLLLVLIALVKSASPSEIVDEGGYYLPYIRWIERFPLVPGIANIEDRMGFNSAFHMASALFGSAWCVPGGAYDLNGLLLVVVGTWFLGGVEAVVRHRFTASAVLRTFGLFFLMRNVLTTPAADLSNMLFGEVVLMLLMQRIERRNVLRADGGPYILLVYALFVTTIKFSSLLLLLVPAYLIMRALLVRMPVRWPLVIGLAVVLLVPWLVRSYQLSGYLVYPLYQVDSFAPDWKVPRSIAVRQYHYVSEFAKTNAKPEESVALAKRRLSEWVPDWFARENAFNKGMALAIVLATIGMLIGSIWRSRRGLPDVDRSFFVLLLWVLLAVWFLKNPAFRFGWAWAIVFVAFAFHAFFSLLHAERWGRVLALGLFGVFLLQSVAKTMLEGRSVIMRHAVLPEPTASPDFPEEKWHGHPVRVTDLFCWGAAPPCIPADRLERIAPRGLRITDGFRPQR
ncbi:MAG: hypothetical protein QM724_07670 [Flavobacteriales bacterium]